MDNPKQSQGALCTEEHRKIARKAAADAMVLLKNEKDLLPLQGVESLAVIGGLADYPAIQGGGSSQVSPDRIVTPLEGLTEALAGKASITFERGLDPEPKPPILDGRLLSPSVGANEQGLRAAYFNQPDYEGDIAHEAVDWRFAKLGFGDEAQSEEGAFSVEWTGVITPRYTGAHHFQMSHSNPDAELIIGDEVLVGPHSARETEMLFMILPLNRREAAIELEAGKSYPITIRYSQPGGIKGFNIFNVACREPAPYYDDAIRSADVADAAVVFVGSGTTSETEGEDRASMRLPDEQNELVEHVSKANPNTVVVVNTGGPVEMPWANKVKAIVQMWLPGQEGGHAIADILTGKVNPSGKLPMTFPERYEDNPTYIHYPGGAQAEYGEGIFVGYRYYTKTGVQPLFPFGHGLSYTKFKLTDAEAICRLKADETIEVRCTLTNSGQRAGAQTVQVYAENTGCPEATAPLSLCAFEKVYLEPGQSEALTFRIPKRASSYFDEDANDWAWGHGTYRIHLGTSAGNIQHSINMVHKG
jgi:beta-glucosidase